MKLQKVVSLKYSKVPTSCFSASEYVLVPSLSSVLSTDSLCVHRTVLFNASKNRQFSPQGLHVWVSRKVNTWLASTASKTNQKKKKKTLSKVIDLRFFFLLRFWITHMMWFIIKSLWLEMPRIQAIFKEIYLTYWL